MFAEVVRLLTTQVDALGAGSGTSLRAYAGVEPVYRVAYVYWLSLAAVVVSVVGVYVLMRSRTGLALTAVRDEPTAAGSLGVQVVRARRLVWVVAGAGSGVVGALLASSTLRVQPDSIYSVNYTAFAIFMVVLGGIGTIEGPVLGAVLFFLLQDSLADLGATYLIVLGLVAVLFTLYVPKGLWGLVSRGRLQLFPIGYRLVVPDRQDDRSAGATRRRSRRRPAPHVPDRPRRASEHDRPDRRAARAGGDRPAVASFDSAASPRFREVMQALVGALHGVARDVRLTEQEWQAAIGFLTRCGQHHRRPAAGAHPALGRARACRC